MAGQEADMAPRIHICIDTADPWALAPFWADALGYEVGQPLSGSTYLYLEAPDPSAPVVYFQTVPEPKVVKNRLHLDLRSAEPDVLIEHLESLGATRIGDRHSGRSCNWFQVMADPAGNEFCVCDESGRLLS
jgi:predicted enzyme related to lactoylglutathione lyase